jgi:hypothetical protein
MDGHSVLHDRFHCILRCAPICWKNRASWIVYNRHANRLYMIEYGCEIQFLFLLGKLISTFMLPSYAKSNINKWDCRKVNRRGSWLTWNQVNHWISCLCSLFLKRNEMSKAHIKYEVKSIFIDHWHWDSIKRRLLILSKIAWSEARNQSCNSRKS